MSGINIVSSLREQQEALKRLLEGLQSGKTWTSDKPGRASVAEIAEQIGYIRSLLVEIEELLSQHAEQG